MTSQHESVLIATKLTALLFLGDVLKVCSVKANKSIRLFLSSPAPFPLEGPAAGGYVATVGHVDM